MDTAMGSDEEIKSLLFSAAELKQLITAKETEIDKLKERYGSLTNTIMRTMELMELDSINAHGFLFFTETKTSVPVPKTLEDKQLLFDYLRERGVFMEMVGIHSQTLNTLYRELSAQAANDGNLDFRLPGVGEPKSFTQLKLRKS